MKLNQEGKKELRETIQKQIEKSGNITERIHLDKDLLEDLLFDTRIHTVKDGYVKDGKKEVLVKYLVWSGDFLSKIDLSEVSFDNVCWDINYDSTRYYENEMGRSDTYANHYSSRRCKEIVLRNTNAVIDFSKSASNNLKTGFGIDINGCDFSGTDLSSNLIDYSCCIYRSSLANTNIRFAFQPEQSYFIANSDLSGNDFSDITVSADGLNPEDIVLFPTHVKLYFSNLSHTNIHLTFTFLTPEEKEEMSNFEKRRDSATSCHELTQSDYDKYRYNFRRLKTEEYIVEAIKNNRLGGCYLNGRRILSEDEKKQLLDSVKEKYSNFKSDIISSTSKTIAEEIAKKAK